MTWYKTNNTQQKTAILFINIAVFFTPMIIINSKPSSMVSEASFLYIIIFSLQNLKLLVVHLKNEEYLLYLNRIFYIHLS